MAPLKTGLRFETIDLKHVEGLPHKVLFPKFGVSKPSDCNESIFVSEIERSSCDILGLYSAKEHDAMKSHFGGELRVNASSIRPERRSHLTRSLDVIF